MSQRPRAPLRAGVVVSLLTAAGGCWLVSVTAYSQSSGPETEAPQARSEALPPSAGSDVAHARCVSCHGSDLIVQQRLSRAGWDREVEKMIGWGAAVQESERGTLVGYLTTHFGQSLRRESAATEHPGATLVETRCLSCHDRRLIEQQRLTAEGWTREVDKMIGWGATLTDREKGSLIEYLASRWSL